MITRAWRAGLGVALLFAPGLARAESSVWVVHGPASTVYLAGSCHALRMSDYPLPAEYDAAYRGSAALVFEAPLDDLQKPDVAAKLMSMAKYDNGGTLASNISPAAYAKVEAFCAQRNYPMAQFQHVRPWMLTMTLTMKELQRVGVDPTNGVDFTYNGKAETDGKKIGSLETVDEQLGFLTLMDDEMDNEQIFETIDELQALGGEMPALLKAWRAGDEAGLEAIVLKEFKLQPKLYKALLVDRNQKWLAKIKEYLNRPGGSMVVVGAAHLIGNDGLVALLQRDGFKVEKLRVAP